MHSCIIECIIVAHCTGYMSVFAYYLDEKINIINKHIETLVVYAYSMLILKGL